MRALRAGLCDVLDHVFDRCPRWAAVFAALVIAFGLLFLLALLVVDAVTAFQDRRVGGGVM